MDIANRVEIAPEDLLDDLRQVQVVFVGELHDHTGHHQAQLSVIDALNEDERRLAIGLEMFRADSQAALDRWTADDLPVSELIAVFNDNWGMWPAYQEIFFYARNQRVKMVGLNIPRSITSQVARGGFKSLAEEDRQMLGNVQCQVDPRYASYLRQANGGHGGHGMQYLYFCEAQLLWDTMMARNLVEFLKENPDSRMVVLAGSAHAWKFGIPSRIYEDAGISYRVLLPEVPGRIDRTNVTREMADYLWLDFGGDGWSF
jgi:uncharacterized iron-regulated protein